MMMNMNKNKNKNKKKDRIDPCIIIIIIIVTHSFECRIKLDWPTWKKKHYNLLQHVYSVNTHTHTLIHKQLMFRWTGGFLLLNFSFKDFFLFLLKKTNSKCRLKRHLSFEIHIDHGIEYIQILYIFMHRIGSTILFSVSLWEILFFDSALKWIIAKEFIITTRVIPVFFSLYLFIHQLLLSRITDSLQVIRMFFLIQ